MIMRPFIIYKFQIYFVKLELYHFCIYNIPFFNIRDNVGNYDIQTKINLTQLFLKFVFTTNYILFWGWIFARL